MTRCPRRRTFALALVALPICGCVTRQMTITSEPAGALVYLNDREVGRTPFTTDFTWYGWYDVVLRKDGYDTVVATRRVFAPWWQYVPVDLAAEIAPWRPADRHTLNFTMRPSVVDEPADAIVARGLDLQRKLPTTMPARG